LVVATGSEARTAARSRGYWIVLSSNRDGAWRPYSIRPDGSRLTPLLARGQALSPSSVSGDGRTIAYNRDRGLYVSRGNGTGLRLVVRRGGSSALSRDGKRLAFQLFSNREGLAVVGTDGRGQRRLTTGDDNAPSWSPDGKALVFHRYLSSRTGPGIDAILVRPLRGKARLLARVVGPGCASASARPAPPPGPRPPVASPSTPAGTGLRRSPSSAPTGAGCGAS